MKFIMVGVLEELLDKKGYNFLTSKILQDISHKIWRKELLGLITN